MKGGKGGQRKEGERWVVEEEKCTCAMQCGTRALGQWLHVLYLPLQECLTLQVGAGTFQLLAEGPSGSPLHKTPVCGRDNAVDAHTYTHTASALGPVMDNLLLLNLTLQSSF